MEMLASLSLRFIEANHGWIMPLSWLILFVGLLQNLIYFIQLPFAWREMRAHTQAGDTESSWQLLVSDVAMPISLLVPAYNEEAGVVASVRSMLALKYPSVEVIVVNDGSKDATLARLIEAFDLKPVMRAHDLSVPHAPVRGLYGSNVYPSLLVIDKENGGKADASNAGINFSRAPLFCVVDADSLLEGEALLRAVRPFMEYPTRMIAVGGTIRIANGCEIKAGQVVRASLPTRFIPLVQSLEYIRAFLIARLALSRVGVLTIISGAFGIFRRNVTVEAGGFSHNTVGEDYDLVVKLHRLMLERKQPYLMRYVPEPVCWTEAPETLKVLAGQRKRWERGALEVFFKHRDMLFNPRYGRIGMVGLPHGLIVDVVGPVADVMGYLLLVLFWLSGTLSHAFFLAFFAVFCMLGVFFSISSLILEEMELRRCPRASDLALLAIVAVVENFGYRQLNNVWRVAGWWQFLRKDKGWGDMHRHGLGN